MHCELPSFVDHACFDVTFDPLLSGNGRCVLGYSLSELCGIFNTSRCCILKQNWRVSSDVLTLQRLS
jgi:hypothetical protein